MSEMVFEHQHEYRAQLRINHETLRPWVQRAENERGVAFPLFSHRDADRGVLGLDWDGRAGGLRPRRRRLASAAFRRRK